MSNQNLGTTTNINLYVKLGSGRPYTHRSGEKVENKRLTVSCLQYAPKRYGTSVSLGTYTKPKQFLTATDYPYR